MTMKRFAFVCVSLVALLAAGCGKVRYPDYYTLALAPSLAAADASGRRLGSLAVHEFVTPPYLRQGRIVYRESPTQVGYYEFHRWVTNPASTITHAVVERLRSSGPFSPVDFDRKQSKSDFLLRGQLERLDEIDYGDGVRVEVKLSAQLVDLRKKSAVWSGTQTETARVEKANVNSVVIEMGHAAQNCIDRLMADMQQQLGGALQPSETPQVRQSKQESGVGGWGFSFFEGRLNSCVPAGATAKSVPNARHCFWAAREGNKPGISLRLGHRGYAYKVPDFGFSRLNVDSWSHTAQPEAGLTLRF